MSGVFGREAAKNRYKQMLFISLAANVSLVASFILLLRHDYPDAESNWVNAENVIQFDGHTYHFFHNKVNFDTAVKRCESRGMQIVTIASYEVNKFLSENVNGNTWIGLQKKEGSWKWHANCVSSYYNWGDNEPNNSGGNENCVQLWGENHEKWNDISCNGEGSYVCEKKCIINTKAVNIYKDCKHYSSGYTTATNIDAKNACEAKNMQLVSIVDKAKNDFLVKNFDLSKEPWIGLDVHAGYWQWNSQNPATFTNWRSNEPNNYNGQESCAHIYPDGTWNDINCNDEFAYICEEKPGSCTGYVASDDGNIAVGKPANQSYTPSNQFYPISISAGNSVDGITNGDLRGGRSCSVATSNGGVTWWMVDLQTFASVGVVRLHNRADCCGGNLTDFSVSVGSYAKHSMTFHDRVPQGYHMCLHWEGTPVAKGDRVDIDCSGYYGRYVIIVKNSGFLTLCEVQVFTTDHSPTPEFVRVDSSLEWDGPQYYFSKEKKTFAEAEKECKLRNMSLASIDSKQENDYVAAQFSDFTEAAGPFIGLHDNSKEGSFEWTNGCPLAYRNFKSGEPNNHGGRENCVQFLVKEYQWNDIGCDRQLFFVCERSSQCSFIGGNFSIRVEVWVLGWIGMVIAFIALGCIIVYTILKRKKVLDNSPASTAIPAPVSTPAMYVLPLPPSQPSAPFASETTTQLPHASIEPQLEVSGLEAPPSYYDAIAMEQV